MSETEVAPAAPKRVGRPRGRKPGMPKVPGSGVKRGVAKWTSETVRELAMPPALELLLGVIAGEAQLVDSGMRAANDKQAGGGVWRRPDLKQRLRAAETILAKCLPDLKATELVASVDQTVRSDSEPVHDVRQISRAIISVLASAELAGEGPESEGWGGLLGESANVPMAARSPPEKIFEKPFDTVSSDGAVAGVSVNATAEPAGVNPATSWSPTTSSDDSYAEADFVQIAPTGAGICRIEPLRDGRGRWGIADRSGRIIEAHHLSRDSAEQQCRRLVEAGII